MSESHAETSLEIYFSTISFPSKELIKIQFRLALITFDRAPENLVAAFRTDIAGFFILNPFFRPHFPPIGNGPQNNLFANQHGKIFNKTTGEVITLVTAGIAFLLGAGPDLTVPAIHKQIVRQTPLTVDIICGKIFSIGENAFTGNSPFVKAHQPLLKFLIIITMGNINGADTAIKAAGCNKIRIYFHGSNPFFRLSFSFITKA
jgi:hypothetical protein